MQSKKLGFQKGANFNFWNCISKLGCSRAVFALWSLHKCWRRLAYAGIVLDCQCLLLKMRGKGLWYKVGMLVYLHYNASWVKTNILITKQFSSIMVSNKKPAFGHTRVILWHASDALHRILTEKRKRKTY